jgi:hypothetical protein
LPLIYKDFADNFSGLNDETRDGGPVAVPGGRAYLRQQWGKIRPYTDEVHWDIHDESWATQERIRDRLAADPSFHGRVYAGCAGQVNLDYMAAIRAPAAILFDINPLQKIMWDGLLGLMAQHADNRTFAAAFPSFVEGLYYRIEQMHGAEAIKGHMSPPLRGPQDRGWGSPSSPMRGMSYQQVRDWVDYRMSEDYSRGKGSWIREPEKYNHLHLMACNDAVATITLDVRDDVACGRVADVLARAGVAVGFLYRSNVGHYLRWNKAEMAAQVEKGREASDYAGLAADTGTYRKAHDNLRRWMDPQQAHMIASDTHSGGYWGNFRPRLRAVRGLAPAPGG